MLILIINVLKKNFFNQKVLEEEVKSLRKDLAKFERRWQEHEESTHKNLETNLILMSLFVIFVNCYSSMF